MAVTKPRKGRFVVGDGLRLKVGGPLYRWVKLHQRALNGQPPLKKPPASTDLEKQHKIVSWAHWGLNNRSHFFYTQSQLRSDMFHRRPGDLAGTIYADCSQFVASILHWIGVTSVRDYDNTGTLQQKGKKLGGPRVGAVAIWGPGYGVHAAFITEKATGGDWWTIGFGHQGAPDRVLLSVMDSYFAGVGEGGVRFYNFLD